MVVKIEFGLSRHLKLYLQNYQDTDDEHDHKSRLHIICLDTASKHEDENFLNLATFLKVVNFLGFISNFNGVHGGDLTRFCRSVEELEG